MSKEKALSIASLNPTDRVLLEEIVVKDLNDLTINDIGILKARRAYLNAEQVEYLHEALSGNLKGIDFDEDEEAKVEPVKELKVDKDGRRIIDPEDFTREVLIQMCKDAELTFDLKMNKQDLANLLNNR
jgi:hypothetical protein